MKLSLTLVFMILVAISFQMSFIECLQCYSCSSCNDPFSASSSVQASCGTNTSYSCYKITASASGSSAVQRGCAADCVAFSINLEIVSSSIHCCTTDLCNGSNDLLKSNHILLLILVIVCYLFN